EEPDLSYGDPDNRRAPDFDRLRRLRDEAGGGSGKPAAPVTSGMELTKIALLRWALRLRRDMPALFPAGAYVPIPMPDGERLLAFRREVEDAALLVVVDLSGRRRPGPVPDALPDTPLRASFPGA